MKVSVLFSFLFVLNLVPITRGYFRLFGLRDVPDNTEATMPDDPAEQTDDPAEQTDDQAEKTDDPAAKVTKNEKTTPSTYTIPVIPGGIDNKEDNDDDDDEVHTRTGSYTADEDGTYRFQVYLRDEKKCNFYLRLLFNNREASTYAYNNKFWKKFHSYNQIKLRSNDKVNVYSAYEGCSFIDKRRFNGHHNGIQWDKEEN